MGLGKEIAHPNTIEHHTCCIPLYFHPEGDNFTYDVGRFEFNAHGEGSAFTHRGVTMSLRLTSPACHTRWPCATSVGCGTAARRST